METLKMSRRRQMCQTGGKESRGESKCQGPEVSRSKKRKETG